MQQIVSHWYYTPSDLLLFLLVDLLASHSCSCAVRSSLSVLWLPCNEELDCPLSFIVWVCWIVFRNLAHSRKPQASARSAAVCPLLLHKLKHKINSNNSYELEYVLWANNSQDSLSDKFNQKYKESTPRRFAKDRALVIVGAATKCKKE